MSRRKRVHITVHVGHNYIISYYERGSFRTKYKKCGSKRELMLTLSLMENDLTIDIISAYISLSIREVIDE